MTKQDAIEMEHPETLNQYRESLARSIADEYGVSISEAEYGVAVHDDDWKSKTEQYAKSGGVFRKAWLNTVPRDWRYMLCKYYPESIPAGYVRPEYR